MSFSSFGGGPTPAPGPAIAAPPAAANELVIPDIYTIFPHLKLAEEIEQCGIFADGSIQSQAQNISAALIDTPPAATAPDFNLRNQLLSIDLRVNGQAAKLHHYMQAEVVQIADALHISEAMAIGLYHAAGCSYHGGSVKDAAVRLYWDCRMRQVRIAKKILILGLHHDDSSAVNFLLSQSLFQHIARALQQRRIKHHQEYPFTKEIHAERNVLAETAFFASYHMQQATTNASWIDAIIQNEHVQTLDPFRDVTRPEVDDWEATWIKDAFSTGLPQYLLTYSILVTASACRPNASIDISELRFKVIPAIATLPDVVESKVLAKDFFLTSLSNYLAGTRHQHPDWYAAANLLCSMGFSGCFENGPMVASSSDDPHALVFAYFTRQTLSSEDSNRVLQDYKNQLDGTPSSSTRSTYGNEYYSLHTDYRVNEASTVTQKTLGDGARVSVIAHSFHADDLKLILEFALGTPIDRKVRGVLFEAAGRIVQTRESAEMVLRTLAEFHAVPPTTMDAALVQQQHYMFFLPSDVEKATHQENVRYDASFGMLFSILISERDTGCEATVGFLKLLTTLTQYILLPALYVEYAIFVLEHMQPHTDWDCHVVYAAAMEFLQCVLVRYDCYSKQFGYEDLNRHLIVEPPALDGAQNTDFLKVRRPATLKDTDAQGPSAGFSVLVSMLCRNRCSLLQRVVTVLTQIHGKTFTSNDKLVLAKALYGDTAPTRAMARIGAHSEYVSIQQRKYYSEKEKNRIMFLSSENWQMRAIQSALTLLCATLMRESEFLRKIQAVGHTMSYIPSLKTHPIKTIHDGTLHLSANLVQLFGVWSPWGALIDKIGVTTGDPGVEALVSAMATAALWGLMDKLSLPQISQVLHTQVDNGKGGTKLAKAVTMRLECFLSRSLTLEDSCYLRFLTKCILADLRSGHKVVASSLFGSSSRVMETLVCLLEMDDFLFGEHSADVAAQCYEIIYLLTKLGDEVAVTASRTSQLREKDFWNFSLKRLFLHGNLTVHHSHSIAWLLKSLSNELSLVGGAASAPYLSASDQQLLAPQPSFYGRYVSDLMVANDSYMIEAFKILPFRVSLEIPSSLQSNGNAMSAINASCEEYFGPDGLYGGRIVNVDLLLQKVEDLRERDEIKAFALSWNESVGLEYAGVHLADALWTVLGSVALTSQHIPSSATQLTVAGSRNVFSALLELLTDGNIRGPTVRTLAKMILTAAGSMIPSGLDEESAHAAIRQVIHAMATQRERSSTDSGSFDHGEVSLLGSALILISMSCRGLSFLLDEAIFLDFSDAFCTLMEVSLFDSADSAASRKLLCAMITFAKENAAADKVKLLLDQALTSATIAALTNVCHDEATLLFFGEVCSIPGIASLLIDQKVLVALRDLARNHRAEEEKRVLDEKSELRITTTSINSPQNLEAVLKCIGAFMASAKFASDTNRAEICTSAAEILCCYQHIFNHAISQFPKNDSALLLLAFTQCVFQVQHLQTDFPTKTNDTLTDFVKAIAQTSLRISNYLLPFEKSSSGIPGWWDEIDKVNIRKQPFSKGVCNAAVQAAELSALGISLLHKFCREMIFHIDKLNEDEMCQTISRCYESLEIVQGLIGSFVGSTGYDVLSADLSDLQNLYGKIYDVLTSLLLLAFVRTEKVKKAAIQFDNGDSFETTLRTLDHLSLSVEGMDGMIDNDENRNGGTLTYLVAAIKKQCSSQKT